MSQAMQKVTGMNVGPRSVTITLACGHGLHIGGHPPACFKPRDELPCQTWPCYRPERFMGSPGYENF